MFGSPITPPPYFSITAIKLFDGCTRVYVLSRRYDLTESMFSPDKQEKEKIIVKLFYRVNNEVNIKINTTFSKFIRIWLPLVAVGVVISILISTALRIPFGTSSHCHWSNCRTRPQRVIIQIFWER